MIRPDNFHLECEGHFLTRGQQACTFCRFSRPALLHLVGRYPGTPLSRSFDSDCYAGHSGGICSTEARMLSTKKAAQQDYLLVRTEQGGILWWWQSAQLINTRVDHGGNGVYSSYSCPPDRIMVIPDRSGVRTGHRCRLRAAGRQGCSGTRDAQSSCTITTTLC